MRAVISSLVALLEYGNYELKAEQRASKYVMALAIADLDIAKACYSYYLSLLKMEAYFS